MNVERYLARLGDPPVTGSPDLDSLAALMKAHLLRIPMENLDIHLGIPIHLEVDRFYRKIVGGRRGDSLRIRGGQPCGVHSPDRRPAPVPAR